MEKNILVAAGDGIGPEIVDEAIKVINAAAYVRHHKFYYKYADVGGVAVDKATAHMSSKEIEEIDLWDDDAKRALTLPQETIDLMDWARDTGGAVLFGAVGRSDLPKRMAELALLGMRKRYKVVNNRPFIIDPILSHLSILFRDPVEVPGIEFISPEESLFNGYSDSKYDDDLIKTHYTIKGYTRSKLEKTVGDAFQKAEESGKHIMLASKYNILVSEKMLSDVFEQVATEYKGQVVLNKYTNNGQLIIDNAGMQIAANPQRYANTIVIADAMFAEFLQAIIDVVSGSKPVNQDALGKIKEQGIYRTFIRELCSGLYFGDRSPPNEPNFAYDTLSYDETTLQNLAKIARKENSRLDLPTIDSLEVNGIPTFKFWADTLDYDAIQNNYSIRHLDIREGVETLLTDPASLGTVISSNMMGDIFTDLAAAVAVGKSLGLMPSSAVNADGFGIYEQISGTAPDIAGKNEANPIAEIRSAAMMLEDFGDREGAQIIYRAIENALKVARTKDIMEPAFTQVSTTEMGSLIAENIKRYNR